MPHSKTIIKVENVKKRYGQFEAVKGVSFDVYEGEIFGLLGPNGAGKSTTLEILETLHVKDSGKVTIQDYNIDTHPDDIKKIIGVQLQSSGYYPNLNLRELINLFCGLYGVDADVEDLLNQVGLVHKIKQQYKTLSGGEKQRFAIATALINKPRILFLDEPTTGLDPNARRQVWQLIKRINEQHVTIILTTHYMDEAETLCHRLAIMNHGALIALNTPEALINDLLNQGFEQRKDIKKANLEDVFIALTGNSLAHNSAFS